MNNEFGSLLRTFRKQAGITQRALGDEIGYKRKQIGLFENGKAAPSLPLVHRMIDVFSREYIDASGLLGAYEAQFQNNHSPIAHKSEIVHDGTDSESLPTSVAILRLFNKVILEEVLGFENTRRVLTHPNVQVVEIEGIGRFYTVEPIARKRLLQEISPVTETQLNKSAASWFKAQANELMQGRRNNHLPDVYLAEYFYHLAYVDGSNGKQQWRQEFATHFNLIMGRYLDENAKDRMLETLETFKEDGAFRDRVFDVELGYRLAQLLASRGEINKSLELFWQTVRQTEIYPVPLTSEAEYWRGLGIINDILDNLHDAECAYRQSLKLYDKFLDRNLTAAQITNVFESLLGIRLERHKSAMNLGVSITRRIEQSILASAENRFMI